MWFVCGLKVGFDLEELGGVGIPLLVEVDNLKITYPNFTESIDYAALVDGLLWSCHPKTITIPSNSTFEINCIKVHTIVTVSNFGRECEHTCLTHLV